MNIHEKIVISLLNHVYIIILRSHNQGWVKFPRKYILGLVLVRTAVRKVGQEFIRSQNFREISPFQLLRSDKLIFTNELFSKIFLKCIQKDKIKLRI